MVSDRVCTLSPPSTVEPGEVFWLDKSVNGDSVCCEKIEEASDRDELDDAEEDRSKSAGRYREVWLRSALGQLGFDKGLGRVFASQLRV